MICREPGRGVFLVQEGLYTSIHGEAALYWRHLRKKTLCSWGEGVESSLERGTGLKRRTRTSRNIGEKGQRDQGPGINFDLQKTCGRTSRCTGLRVWEHRGKAQVIKRQATNRNWRDEERRDRKETATITAFAGVWKARLDRPRPIEVRERTRLSAIGNGDTVLETEWTILARKVDEVKRDASVALGKKRVCRSEKRREIQADL